MRTLALCCSPRRQGNTEAMLREALASANALGANTELILVAGKRILPCDACDTCRESGVCRIQDDMQPIYEQLDLADAVIFGTPVYFLNMSAQAKIIIDRTYAGLWNRRLEGKVAASVLATRRIGAAQTASLLNGYFIAQGMVIAGTAVGYAWEKGEVTHGVGSLPMLSAFDEARALGRRVVRLAERLARGKG